MNREALLHSYLAEMAPRAFAAGTHDCALFAAGWVDRLRGSNLVGIWQRQYRSLTEGRRMLRNGGIPDLASLARLHLDPVGGWAFAQPGDIALIEDVRPYFGIVGSGGLIHGLQIKRGLDSCSLIHAREVFRP